MIRVVAIDGGAASGKSTLAKSLAKALDWAYFDTGAMYRSVALAAVESGVELENEDAIVELAETMSMEISPDPQGRDGLTIVEVNGEDVSSAIRTPEVGKAVAPVAVHKRLRDHMVKLQQDWINKNGDSVVEGRDIAAVVWPEAILKIYLTADLEERSRRRAKEFDDANLASSETVESQLATRDASDSTKGGLIRVGSAVEIDTTFHTPEQTLEEVLAMLKDIVS